MPNEYIVGYKRPPVEGRFSKGHSGNPRGRPKGSRNVASIFHSITKDPIRITENGKQRTVTKIEAAMIQLLNKAVGGDFRAMRELMALDRHFEHRAESEFTEMPDREKDDEVLQRLIRRMQSSAPSMEANQLEVPATTAEENENGAAGN